MALQALAPTTSTNVTAFLLSVGFKDSYRLDYMEEQSNDEIFDELAVKKGAPKEMTPWPPAEKAATAIDQAEKAATAIAQAEKAATAIDQAEKAATTVSPKKKVPDNTQMLVGVGALFILAGLVASSMEKPAAEPAADDKKD